MDYANAQGKRVRATTLTKDKELAEAVLKTVEARVIATRLLVTGRYDPVTSADDLYHWMALRWPKSTGRERLAMIFAKFQGRCIHCGCQVHIPDRFEKKHQPDRAVMDHRIARAIGGGDGFDNIQLSCQNCNLKKSDKLPQS